MVYSVWYQMCNVLRSGDTETWPDNFATWANRSDPVLQQSLHPIGLLLSPQTLNISVRGIPLWSRHEATILQATEDLWCTYGMAYVMWLPLLEGGVSCLRSSSPDRAEHLQNHIKNHFSVRDILILWAVRRWNENRGIRLTQTYLGSDQVCSPLLVSSG